MMKFRLAITATIILASCQGSQKSTKITTNQDNSNSNKVSGEKASLIYPTFCGPIEGICGGQYGFVQQTDLNGTTRCVLEAQCFSKSSPSPILTYTPSGENNRKFGYDPPGLPSGGNFNTETTGGNTTSSTGGKSVTTGGESTPGGVPSTGGVPISDFSETGKPPSDTGGSIAGGVTSSGSTTDTSGGSTGTTSIAGVPLNPEPTFHPIDLFGESFNGYCIVFKDGTKRNELIPQQARFGKPLEVVDNILKLYNGIQRPLKEIWIAKNSIQGGYFSGMKCTGDRFILLFPK